MKYLTKKWAIAYDKLQRSAVTNDDQPKLFRKICRLEKSAFFAQRKDDLFMRREGDDLDLDLFLCNPILAFKIYDRNIEFIFENGRVKVNGYKAKKIKRKLLSSDLFQNKAEFFACERKALKNNLIKVKFLLKTIRNDSPIYEQLSLKCREMIIV